MTVGIDLTNGLEAVVISDSLFTKGQRESTTEGDKVTIIPGYNAVLHGEGDGEIILGIYKNMDKILGLYNKREKISEDDLDYEDEDEDEDKTPEEVYQEYIEENEEESNEEKSEIILEKPEDLEEKVDEKEQNNEDKNKENQIDLFVKNDPLYRFVKTLHIYLQQMLREYVDQKYDTRAKDCIMMGMHMPPKIGGEFLIKETTDIVYEEKEELLTEITGTNLRLTAYDKDKERIRIFNINYEEAKETVMGLPMGTGADGADAYYSEKLQGRNLKTASKEELLWHALNMYQSSTINIGVGGTPKVSIVHEEGVDEISRKEICALTNIVGYYKAEGIDKKTAVTLFTNVLKGEPYLEQMNKSIDIENLFERICLPFYAIQEEVNNRPGNLFDELFP